MKNNENKTELAIPSAGEDAEQQGFSFIANVNAKDTVTLKDSLSFINHFLNLNIGSLDFSAPTLLGFHPFALEICVGNLHAYF